MFSKVSALAVLGLVLACGPRQGDIDGLSLNTGMLSGQVLTTELQPLAQARVSVNAGGSPLEASTDALGNFSFAELAPGTSVLVTIQREGYATYRQTVNVPPEGAESRTAVVGPVALTRLDGALQFFIRIANGKPASGASALLEASPAATVLQQGMNYGVPVGMVHASATADAAGVLTFTEMPTPQELARITGTTGTAINYVLTLSSVDSNGDGVVDAAGEVRTFSAKELLEDSTPRTVELKDPRGAAGMPLSIMTTNVPSLSNAMNTVQANMVRPGEAVVVVFNQAIQSTSVSARLTNEVGNESLATTVSLGGGGTVLSVTPSAPVEVGAEYNLQVKAVSLDSGTTLTALGYFFGGDVASPRTPSAPGTAPVRVSSAKAVETGLADGLLNSNEKMFIWFDQPVGAFGMSNPYLAGYAHADLNGSGVIGDAIGEHGFNGPGFPVQRAEPLGDSTSPFLLRASTYTTRYMLTYVPPGISGLPTLPSGTKWTLGFSRSMDNMSGFHTVWGQTINVNVELTMVGAVPP